MVFTSTCLFLTKIRKAPRKYLRQGFIDTLRLYVRGGSGGNGYPKYGGVGGQGGSVILVAKEKMFLEHVLNEHQSKRIFASHGTDSSQKYILGPPGEDVKVEVPVGVTVYTDEGKRLGELNKEGDEVIVAKGGIGGHPKNGFLGSEGQAWPIKLDLKLIADVGLVGFPNAGKSTLLRSISHAKPKIASYPFTTIRPNIGMLKYKDLRQISMADLPGLIEGAHANRGMGHKFLKHVERTTLLLLVVDINGFQLSPQHTFRSCLDTVILLNKELELYNESLLEKPAVLVINKMDTDGALKKFEKVREQITALPEIIQEYSEEIRPTRILEIGEIIPISAKESVEDIEKVKNTLRNLLDINAEKQKLKEVVMNDLNVIRNLKENLRERATPVV
ncbi:GTP-binding protein 10 homolog isoform X3 [Agrilus planipennis]|uniref:GTP-binding protein 10 homolog isoform X1 n=1 Tax=Agrilus planipennis TaxID=224129 RepID=A0A1W4WNA7_AGRPL|nr:GTP-binding protein 10 homolog isoform X1 [Agrilus planipennis]XP_018321947.1 GTP-binding protein 10 homolog isoform X2 [Agrilus planipennis]XP_018321948.1 GTP-binding protein 10 homolog isoform X3 [Agrilus planipennis]